MHEAYHPGGRELTDGELEDLAKACEDAAKISIENHCAGDYLHNFEIAEALRKYARLRKDHATVLWEYMRLKMLVTDISRALKDQLESDGGRLATIEAALMKAGFMKEDGR